MIAVNLIAMFISLTCTIVLYINQAAKWAIALNLAAFLFNAGIVIGKVLTS